MNSIVCIKQVPGTTKVGVDEKTGVLQRDGADAKLNPYDLYAIETALRLREEWGGTVKAFTMGPGQSAEIIREAFMMGADEGAVLSDKAFAGSDVLATGYALSQGIRKLGSFDIIICGKQTTDGDTAQVGPETAEFLGIPHASNVTGILEVHENTIRVEADMGDCVTILDIPFPCLITVEKDIYTPRLPSYKRKMASADKTVTILTLQDMEDRNPLHYGLNGSPTQVEKIFPPEPSTEKLTVEGDGDEAAEFLLQLLKTNKFL